MGLSPLVRITTLLEEFSSRLEVPLDELEVCFYDLVGDEELHNGARQHSCAASAAPGGRTMRGVRIPTEGLRAKRFCTECTWDDVLLKSGESVTQARRLVDWLEETAARVESCEGVKEIEELSEEILLSVAYPRSGPVVVEPLKALHTRLLERVSAGIEEVFSGYAIEEAIRLSTAPLDSLARAAGVRAVAFDEDAIESLRRELSAPGWALAHLDPSAGLPGMMIHRCLKAISLCEGELLCLLPRPLLAWFSLLPEVLLESTEVTAEKPSPAALEAFAVLYSAPDSSLGLQAVLDAARLL